MLGLVSSREAFLSANSQCQWNPEFFLQILCDDPLQGQCIGSRSGLKVLSFSVELWGNEKKIVILLLQ